MTDATTPDALSIIVVGMSAVLATLTFLMVLCHVNRLLADSLTALSRKLTTSTATMSVETKPAQTPAATESQGRLVAVLTAAACEALGGRVRLLSYESHQQQGKNHEWVQMGKQELLESHKVKLGR
jgi:Na+-transporting methylmalonyl-CoA/oxaloacetate decarboxylase gamma subunit